MEEQSYLSNDLPIDDAAASCLKETTSWTRFLAICFTVFIVLIFFGFMAAIFAQDAIMHAFERSSLPIAKMGMAVLMLTLIIVLLVFSVLTYFLFRFSEQTRKAVIHQDQQALENGISGLKNYLIISGIFGILSFISALFQLFKL